MALICKETTNFDRVNADEVTKQIALQISKLANGLTPKQFTDAIEIALEDVNLFGCIILELADKQ